MLADVEKMYHKVLIRTENRKFQSILYRSDRSEDIRIRYSHLHYRVCIISSYTHIARNRNPMRQKLRLLVGVDKWEAQLLCAKSKVTSFRSISFPGLELCGVLLFTQLMSRFNKALDIVLEYYWLNSCLCELKFNSLSRWKIFVVKIVESACDD